MHGGMSLAIAPPRRVSERAAPEAGLPRRTPDFETLPAVMRYLNRWVGNPLRNRWIPASALRWLLARSLSPLVRESLLRPGGWRSMELVYANAGPVDWFDYQALKLNPVSIAARNRRRYVTFKLRSLIEECAAESGTVRIAGVGSGPGLHVQQAIADTDVDAARIEALLIDLDDSAFDFGRARARELGIERSVRFVKGDARKLNDVLARLRPQIVKLIGLIEYLSDDEVCGLLRSLHACMPVGGTVLTHGLVDAHNTGPFLERAFGLRHVQRDENQVRALLHGAGFQPVGCFVEPLGIYPIVTAVRE